jgi:hypothetical protein
VLAFTFGAKEERAMSRPLTRQESLGHHHGPNLSNKIIVLYFSTGYFAIVLHTDYNF